MPRRAKKPCAQPACPTVTDQTRCGDHQRQAEQRRGHRNQRGYDNTHQRIRRQVITEETDCWLCSQPVDKTLPGTHPDGPTADHVVQLTHGGANHRLNYRLAHNRCNSGRNQHA